MPDPEWIQAWAFVLYDLLLIGGLLYAARQVGELRSTRQAQAYMEAVAQLQDEDLRSARAAVFVVTEPDWTKWQPDEKDAAERVAHNYDTVGLAIRHGLFPAEWLLVAWRNSLQRSWQQLQGLVRDYQRQRGREFWCNFEALGEAATAFQLQVNWRKFEREQIADWEARKA